MALEPIETAQLWVATVAGLAGLGGLLWQIYQHFSGREEESNRKLNRNVLKPWSEVRMTPVYEQDQPNRIAFTVPKEALPPDVAPSTGEQGLDIQRLPGLAKGEAFLRKHYGEIFSEWVVLKGRLRQYENLLRRRREVVEPKVRDGMLGFYPSLTPVRTWSEKEYKVNTYILKHIIADVETIGYWGAKDGEVRLNVQESKMTNGEGKLLHEYRASNLPWLKVLGENAIDRTLLEQRVGSWITDPKVRSANTELFECFTKLEEAIDKFRRVLQEASVNVELYG